MCLQLNASHQQVIDAINNFNAGYHEDFRSTRSIAKKYLEDDGVKHSNELAASLERSLINFGAGQRQAPKVRKVKQVAEFLGCEENHQCFAVLNKCGSMLYESGCPVADFGKHLLSIINATSREILDGATNVTYPTKALMLVTGFMPALDSQVRSGLSKTGLRGFGGTTFRMPEGNGSLEARKLIALPIILGEFYRNNSRALKEAVATSEYPYLKDEPGRLLDVMLFMQGKTKGEINPMIQSDRPQVADWYTRN